MAARCTWLFAVYMAVLMLARLSSVYPPALDALSTDYVVLMLLQYALLPCLGVQALLAFNLPSSAAAAHVAALHRLSQAQEERAGRLQIKRV